MMHKKTRRGIVMAASFVVLGLILFTAVMTAYNWDFTKLNTVKYETNTHQVREAFRNISVKTETADIFFVPADDGICRVVCYEMDNEKHSVAVRDGILTIDVLNEKEWYEYIGITLGTPKITVYLPDAEYDMLFIKESTGDIEIPRDFKFESMDISVSTGDVKNYASASELMKIKTSTGDIRVENVSANMMDLSVSTGKVIAGAITCEGDMKIDVSTGDAQLADIRCNAIISSGSTGDLSLKNVVATERFSIDRSTGDVKLDGCDAAEVFIKTDTGDITGSLLTGKLFIVETDTGSADVPQTATGGRCEITTDTGDIRIKIEQ